MKRFSLFALPSVEKMFKLNNAIKGEKRVIFYILSLVILSVGVLNL